MVVVVVIIVVLAWLKLKMDIESILPVLVLERPEASERMIRILEQEDKSKSKKKTMGRVEGGDPKDLKCLSFFFF